MPDVEAGPTSRDAFFDGRLVLDQPRHGHRSGTDAVLLASAVAEDFAGRCSDVGAGAGVVGLGVAAMNPAAAVTLVERDASLVALALRNAVPFPGAAVVGCDILDKRARRAALPEPADLVLTNPPFHDLPAHRPSPDAARRDAHALPDGLELADWIAACLACLRDRGTLIAIHRAAALPALLAALAGRAGAVAVKPVLPRAGAPAHRVLLRAVKGSRAPFTLAAPLVLHEGCGRFTAEAEALHRGVARLDW